MKTKHQVHNLIILDESGSMESIKKSIINGFNETVQTIKGIQKQFPEQEHFISLVTFNGFGVKPVHILDPVSKLNEINSRNYIPDSMTPLFDAMGHSITKLKQLLEDRTDYNVLVTILTDGEENASREFSGKQIKKFVEQLKEENWTFTYIGTDHDISKMADSLSIDNTLMFHKSAVGIKDMFMQEREARMRFSKKIISNEDVSRDYFKDEDA